MPRQTRCAFDDLTTLPTPESAITNYEAGARSHDTTVLGNDWVVGIVHADREDRNHNVIDEHWLVCEVFRLDHPGRIDGSVKLRHRSSDRHLANVSASEPCQSGTTADSSLARGAGRERDGFRLGFCKFPNRGLIHIEESAQTASTISTRGPLGSRLRRLSILEAKAVRGGPA